VRSKNDIRVSKNQHVQTHNNMTGCMRGTVVGVCMDKSFMQTYFTGVSRSKQARRKEGVGGKLPRAPRGLGAPPSPRNIKFTRMHHFEKKNLKNFFPEGPHKNVWGPTRMFSRAPLWLWVSFPRLKGCPWPFVEKMQIMPSSLVRNFVSILYMFYTC